MDKWKQQFDEIVSYYREDPRGGVIYRVRGNKCWGVCRVMDNHPIFIVPMEYKTIYTTPIEHSHDLWWVEDFRGLWGLFSSLTNKLIVLPEYQWTKISQIDNLYVAYMEEAIFYIDPDTHLPATETNL